MFCPKCGRELTEEAKFCPGCGCRISTEEERIEEDSADKDIVIEKKNRYIPYLISGIVALLVMVILVVGISVYSSPQRKYDRQMSLGQRYLNELNYEKAIAAYKAAIEINPKDPGAYKELAEVYIAMGDMDAAEEVLQRGIDETDSKSLENMLSSIKEPDTMDLEETKNDEQSIDKSEIDTNYESETTDNAISDALTKVDLSEVWSIDLEGNYSSWQEAYCTWIENTENENRKTNYEYCSLHYLLIYIDNDDIPELFVVGNSEAEGECVIAYHNGKLSQLYLNRLYGALYIERSGLIYNWNGNSDYYPLNIAYLYQGKFFKCGKGIEWIEWVQKGDDYESIEHYEWEGEEVSKEEFEKEYMSIFDESIAKRPYDQEPYDCDEMMTLLKGMNASQAISDEIEVPMDSQQQYEANVFVSNFVEAYLGNYDRTQWTSKQVLDFALIHTQINYGNSLGFSDDGMYFTMSLDEINKVTDRYLGISLSDKQAEKYPDDSISYYNGKKFYYICTDGCELGNTFAVVDKKTDLGDGTYRLDFHEYALDLDKLGLASGGNVSKEHYEMTPEQAENRYGLIDVCRGEAIVEPYIYNNRDTYRLISYRIY